MEESADCALSSSASIGLKQRWNQLEESFRNLRPARRSGVGLARAPPTSLPAGQRAESAAAEKGPSCHAIALCDSAVAQVASRMEFRTEKTHAVAATDASVHNSQTAGTSPFGSHSGELDRGSLRFRQFSLTCNISPPTSSTACQSREVPLSQNSTLPIPAVQPGLRTNHHASCPFDQAVPSACSGTSLDTVLDSCQPKNSEEDVCDTDQSPSQGALQRLTQRMRDLEADIQSQRLRDLEQGIRQALQGAQGWQEEIVFTEKDGSTTKESVPVLVAFLRGLVWENKSLRERESALLLDLQRTKIEARDVAERVDLQMRDLLEEMERLRSAWVDQGDCAKCASKIRANTEEAASYSSGQSTNYTEQIFDADDELASCSAEGSCDIERHYTRSNLAIQQSSSETERRWPQVLPPFDSKGRVPPLEGSRLPFGSYLVDLETQQEDTVALSTITTRKHMLRPEVLSPKGLSCEAPHHGGLRDEAPISTNPALQKLLGMVSLNSFTSPPLGDAASLWRSTPTPRSFDRGSAHGTGLYATRASRSDSPVERLARQSTRPNPLLLGLSRPSL